MTCNILKGERLDTIGCMVPTNILDQIIAKAKRDGIGRTEWLRRLILREVEGDPHKNRIRMDAEHQAADAAFLRTNPIELSTAEQAQRKNTTGLGRPRRKFTFNGIEDSLKGWADRYGVTYATIYNRMTSGQTFEEALKAAIISKETGRRVRRSRKNF